MKKAPVILVIFVATVLLSATVLADVTWKTLYLDKRTLAQANTLGTEWGYTFPTYPRILHVGNIDYGGDLGTDQGLQLYVAKPGGNERVPIIEIYTGTIPLWSGGSYFVIKGASIYSNFPEQKYTLDDLVEKYGEANAYDKSNPYYFPSEDRKIFKLEIEVDQSGVDEFILHKVYLEDQATFANDLQNYFKSDGKVPVNGTSQFAALPLTPSSFEEKKAKEISFSFKAPEELSNGYTLYIAKSPTAKDNVEEAVTELTSASDWLATKVDKLFAHTTPVAENADVSNKLSEPPELEPLNNKEKGKYLVVAVDTADERVVAATFLEITEEGETPTGCKACDTILKCLACIDKEFVEGIFD